MSVASGAGCLLCNMGVPVDGDPPHHFDSKYICDVTVDCTGCDRPGCEQPRNWPNHQPCGDGGERCRGLCERKYGVPCHSWPDRIENLLEVVEDE